MPDGVTGRAFRKRANEAQGFEVVREALEIPPTRGSRSYLETKKLKFGHLLELASDVSVGEFPRLMRHPPVADLDLLDGGGSRSDTGWHPSE